MTERGHDATIGAAARLIRDPAFMELFLGRLDASTKKKLRKALEPRPKKRTTRRGRHTNLTLENPPSGTDLRRAITRMALAHGIAALAMPLIDRVIDDDKEGSRGEAR